MQRGKMESRGAGGRLAVLMPGLGAVATTFVAGLELIRQGKGLPVGSVSQLGVIPDRAGNPRPIRDYLPLVPAEDLVFGAWDIVKEDGYQVARRSEVLSNEHLELARPALEALRPRPGVHDPNSVRRIAADNVLQAANHREKVEAVREDIRRFKRELGADRAVMVFCASTEVHRPKSASLDSLRAFERGLDESDPAISPTLIYAYAALREGVPFVNGTPNVSVDTVAIQELARDTGMPIAGKDFKSGQTMMKTVLAPAFKARMLGLRGWFSTNILGNRDGEVLDDPEAFRSKEITKTGVLDSILPAGDFPDLYGNVSHKVAIHYYPPRGDAKEGWDNIDIFGWLGYQMQIKIDFLCRDSILAAPLVLDLALFADLAARRGRSGLQDWLSFYFKSPSTAPGSLPEHDLFAQRANLDEALREMAEERQRPRPAVARAVGG